MGTNQILIQAILDSWSSEHGFCSAVEELPSFLDQNHVTAFSQNERDLLDSHRHPGRRRSWVAGRLAARKALKKWSIANKEPVADCEILRDPSGKPRISGRQDLHLSISHSGTLAVAIVGKCPVGVDLERQEDRPDSLARAFFSPEENQWMRQDPGQRTRRCNELWTRKEAVSKLLGKGGSLVFSRLPVLDGQTPWSLKSASTSCYSISLALPGDA